MSLRRMRPRGMRGLTMIEMLVGIAILGILSAIAIPSMYEYTQRKRVQGVADQMMLDLRYARSMQVEKRNDITIRFSSDTNTTCYAIYDYAISNSCNCLNTPVCAPAAVNPTIYRLVRLERSSGIAMVPESLSSVRVNGDAGVALSSATLQPMELTVRIESASGGTLRVKANQLLQPRTCSVSGHTAIYGAC